MQPDEFTRHLDRETLAPVYLFMGEGDLRMEEAWERLVAKTLPAGARRMNGERLLAREIQAAQVIARLSTLPMFGSRQLLMVQHVEAWPKEQRSLLLDYLTHPYPTACLVLTAAQKKGLEKIEPAVEAVGRVVRFPALTEKDAPRWLQERARRLHKALAPHAAAFLLEQVGPELHRLEREIEKLASYVGARERIELEDVKQVVGHQRAFSVFELLRFVSRNQGYEALMALRGLMASGESPLGILALLTRQVRHLWQIKDGLARGLTAPQLAQRLGVPPFVVKNAMPQASSFSDAELYRIHRAIRETDLALKSTGTAPEALIEALILTLCAGNKKGP